ncbi:MAG TPA: ATP synthase F0 subunit B [Candidatus Binatia bacterium]
MSARRRFLSLIATALVVATPALSFAASGEEGGHGPSWTMTILAMVNFSIYAYIIYRFAWPPIAKYLKERRANVVATLEAAAQAHAEAEKLRAEFESKLRNVEAEAARARDELMEIARREAEHVVENAKRTAERIRTDARLVADQEIARARRMLQEEAAELITRIAAELVSKQLTPDDQMRFVKDFIAETQAASRNGGRVEVGS